MHTECFCEMCFVDENQIWNLFEAPQTSFIFYRAHVCEAGVC